jgi:hypothetical protein
MQAARTSAVGFPTLQIREDPVITALGAAYRRRRCV